MVAMRSLLVLVLVIFSAYANATPITYDGRDLTASYGGPFPLSDAAHAAFQAAVIANGQTANAIDFESAPVGSFTSLNVGAGVTATFSDQFDSVSGISNNNTPGIGVFDTTRPGTQYVWFQTQPGPSTATLTFSFATPINSFGAYITGLGSTDVMMTLSFNDGTSELLGIPGGTPNGFTDAQFFGFTDFGASITSVAYQLHEPLAAPNYYYVGVDDVNFSSPVPEPATLTLTALGLAGLVRRSRRRRAAR